MHDRKNAPHVSTTVQVSDSLRRLAHTTVFNLLCWRAYNMHEYTQDQDQLHGEFYKRAIRLTLEWVQCSHLNRNWTRRGEETECEMENTQWQWLQRPVVAGARALVHVTVRTKQLIARETSLWIMFKLKFIAPMIASAKKLISSHYLSLSLPLYHCLIVVVHCARYLLTATDEWNICAVVFNDFDMQPIHISVLFPSAPAPSLSLPRVILFILILHIIIYFFT